MASSSSSDGEAPIFSQSSFSSATLVHYFAISWSSGLKSSSFIAVPSFIQLELDLLNMPIRQSLSVVLAEGGSLNMQRH